MPRQPEPTEPPSFEGVLGLPLELVWIDCSGTSGPAADDLPEENPAGGFFIARTEITNAQYAAFVADSGYDGSDHPSSKPGETFLRHFDRESDGRFACPPGREHDAVTNVSWYHAAAFCRWLSEQTGAVVRLPTDREWERAAGGTERRTYPWGDEWDATRCNWGDSRNRRFGGFDGYPEIAPVGSFPDGATPEGVLDMAGNAWEWTLDQSLRGGPWCLGPEMMRCDQVAREDADRADDKFGFRVVVEATPINEH
ncbi:MAG: SUMF1/EgtB/PvdO family nonheme iron enzyme [Phycisphaerales bacterium]|nr:SUMF1/EgtB/PvdO family nonheme iron enzyme [Phycisphaerales bacterium]